MSRMCALLLWHTSSMRIHRMHAYCILDQQHHAYWTPNLRPRPAQQLTQQALLTASGKLAARRPGRAASGAVCAPRPCPCTWAHPARQAGGCKGQTPSTQPAGCMGDAGLTAASTTALNPVFEQQHLLPGLMQLVGLHAQHAVRRMTNLQYSRLRIQDANSPAILHAAPLRLCLPLLHSGQCTTPQEGTSKSNNAVVSDTSHVPVVVASSQLTWCCCRVWQCHQPHHSSVALSSHLAYAPQSSC